MGEKSMGRVSLNQGTQNINAHSDGNKPVWASEKYHLLIYAHWKL